jgi:hypothetical protein
MLAPACDVVEYRASKRQKTGGEKRRLKNSLPHTVYIFAYDPSRSSMRVLAFGFVTLTAVHLLSEARQDEGLERQRAHFGDTVAHVVWTCENARVFAEPVELAYPGDLSHVGTLVSPSHTTAIRQLMKENKHDWTMFLRMPLGWCLAFTQRQKFIVTSIKYCLALGVQEPTVSLQLPRGAPPTSTAAVVWAEVLEGKVFKPDLI